jgi:hypothetical protein
MARKISPRNPRATYRRKVVAARRFGPSAKCPCGEGRPQALIPGSEPAICAACDRRKRGRRKTDDHHIMGKANGPMILRVPVNDHRGCLSEAQNEWPQKTLTNPDGSPLLTKAASIRGVVDTISYLHEKLLLPAAEMLELLDTREERKSSKK